MGNADDLEFHVLAFLTHASESRRYGWQIPLWLEEHLDLKVRVTSVYRILKRFHDRGWVDRRDGEQHDECPGLPRQYYTLNKSGLAHTRSQANDMIVRAQRLGKIAEEVLRRLEDRRDVR